jgi:hypothetical protein
MMQEKITNAALEVGGGGGGAVDAKHRMGRGERPVKSVASRSQPLRRNQKDGNRGEEGRNKKDETK